MDKTIPDIKAAVADIPDNAKVMIGGFGGSGAPIELIHALIDRYATTGSPGNLTIINNNAGNGQIGIAAMILAGMIRKMICSFPRSSDPRAFTGKYLANEIELELVPQGTLAERIRAAGAGIPAFFTPSGYGTELSAGKQIQEFDGKPFVMERSLHADFALIKAAKGDTHGNLTYRLAGRNFNPLMCMAAKHTVAQVSKIVAPGDIDPETVITPGIFVNGLVQVSSPQQEELLIRAGEEYL
ncbi:MULTISPECIES: 3-oxoacid CoA-transferase subunit A [unclassified Phaeobacter]|uniref:3-oxoacid CoA-transferase subunit A n=1 Tax=unclassified Phaeobacter TaxID=2621772 RepID=UPI003A852CCD